MIETGVSDTGGSGDVELLASASGIDVFEALAERLAQHGTIVNPVECGLDVEVARRDGDTGTARRDGAELVDPAEKHIVGVAAIGRGENTRQDAEQFVIPVPLAGGDGRVMVLEKSPDPAQSDQIGDLSRREAVERNVGAGIELGIWRQAGLGRRL